MSEAMLLWAAKAACGESSKEFEIQKVMLAKSVEISENKSERMSVPKVQKKKEIRRKEQRFHQGDSVMVYPDKKIPLCLIQWKSGNCVIRWNANTWMERRLSMAQINVSKVSLKYEGGNMFEQVTFAFDTDWKIGFIGRNGEGKTTFLRILMGKEEYTGTVSSPVAFDCFPYPMTDAQKAYPFAESYKQLKPGAELWRLTTEMELLHLSAELLYSPFITLGRTEQRKIMLALLFAGENEFLLIDDPTNKMSAEDRELVKNYLEQKKGFLLVSHDRDLLDACVDHMLILNSNTMEVQKGNFSDWWENKSRWDALAQLERELLVEAREYGLTYKDAIHPVFSNLNFTISKGERVVLRGKSGSGKSTLMRAILANSTEMKGELKYNESGLLETASGLVISYVNQDTGFLKGSITEFCERQGISEGLLRTLLRQLDFDREQFAMPMEDYTEGKKKKVLLAASLLKPAHLYIWDEPLNYIDVFSRMQIEKLILDFQPTMLVVEPDVQFGKRIATKVIEM